MLNPNIRYNRHTFVSRFQVCVHFLQFTHHDVCSTDNSQNHSTMPHEILTKYSTVMYI